MHPQPYTRSTHRVGHVADVQHDFRSLAARRPSPHFPVREGAAEEESGVPRAELACRRAVALSTELGTVQSPSQAGGGDRDNSRIWGEGWGILDIGILDIGILDVGILDIGPGVVPLGWLGCSLTLAVVVPRMLETAVPRRGRLPHIPKRHDADLQVV